METIKPDFNSAQLYIGIYVHKKQWTATVLTKDIHHVMHLPQMVVTKQHGCQSFGWGLKSRGFGIGAAIRRINPLKVTFNEILLNFHLFLKEIGITSHSENVAATLCSFISIL